MPEVFQRVLTTLNDSTEWWLPAQGVDDGVVESGPNLLDGLIFAVGPGAVGEECD